MAVAWPDIVGVLHILSHIVTVTQTFYPRSSVTGHFRGVFSTLGPVGKSHRRLSSLCRAGYQAPVKSGLIQGIPAVCEFLLVGLRVRYLCQI